MNRFLIAGVFFIALGACKPEAETANVLKTGIWRAVIQDFHSTVNELLNENLTAVR